MSAAALHFVVHGCSRKNIVTQQKVNRPVVSTIQCDRCCSNELMITSSPALESYNSWNGGAARYNDDADFKVIIRHILYMN